MVQCPEDFFAIISQDEEIFSIGQILKRLCRSGSQTRVVSEMMQASTNPPQVESMIGEVFHDFQLHQIGKGIKAPGPSSCGLTNGGADKPFFIPILNLAQRDFRKSRDRLAVKEFHWMEQRMETPMFSR